MGYKLLETWYDTVLYFGILLVSLVVFLEHWKDEYQIRYAEIVIQEFLTDVTVDGKIRLEDYEEIVRNLENINSQFDADICCMKNVLQPVYGLISEDRLSSFFLARNIKEIILLPEYSITIEEENTDLLQLQTESNSTLLATLPPKYLKLPEESRKWNVEAVKTYQEVYEGEELITLCRVDSPKGSFYVVAEPLIAETSGSAYLELLLNGNFYQIPIEVLCHPKIICCEKGHEIVNSKDVIEGSKANGKIVCPYCKILPEKLFVNKSIILKKTGTDLCGDDIAMTVIYMDGKKEEITPEMEEWQDTYDRNYCGIQQVTIKYRGMETVCTVVSENEDCQECGKSCNDRCYMDYIEKPYCLSCMSQTAMFTGKVYEDEQWITTDELVVRLDETGELLLERGDYIQVCLFNGEKRLSLIQQKVKQNGMRR